MVKWTMKDIAQFEHNENGNDTRIGEVDCLLCEWHTEPVSQLIFPTIDDVVGRHVREAHPDMLNAAGVNRVPHGDGGLVYFIIENP